MFDILLTLIARELERQLATEKSAERSKRAFGCPIPRFAVGPGSCYNTLHNQVPNTEVLRRTKMPRVESMIPSAQLR